MKYLFICFAGLFTITLKAQPSSAPTNAEVVDLPALHITATRLFKNDTARYQYNELKLYVSMVWPYVDTAVHLFQSMEAQTSPLGTAAKRRYYRSREREIRSAFSDRLKELNSTQGKLLVLLLNRELHTTCARVLDESDGFLHSCYYRTWAALNGMPLNETYHANDYPELEAVLRALGHAGKEAD